VSPVSPSAPQKASAALNRLTLCFLDSSTERDFRGERAEASRAILRRFIIFMVVLVAFATTGIRHKLEVARAAGMPVPPQLDIGGTRLAFAATLALVLFLATLSRRFVPYLHSVTAACLAGLVLVESWHSRELPLAYALYGTILNLVVLYVASQLRFAMASVLGVASSLLYLCCIAARNAPYLQENPLLQLQMGVTVTILMCANLLLMFVTHQRELSARLAYHRARLLEQRSSELESALSSLKQAELQLVENAKQATVGRLVAGILHEMNTPLGALSSATQTLDRGLRRLRSISEPAPASLNPGHSDSTRGCDPDAEVGSGIARNGPGAEFSATLEAAQRLTTVQAQSGERIREVVEGLKQFVSLDQAALQVADVRSGLSTAVALIRPSLPAGVGLRLVVPDCPIWVQCFPAKLNQVFLNLLKNSSNAFDGQLPAARAEIVVSARVASDRLFIEIADTGRGIEPERLEKIFDLDFSRQGSRVKLRLGLPASRGVVEAIGGTLTLASQMGRGCSAIIELPLGQAPLGLQTGAVTRRPGVSSLPAASPSAADQHARMARSI
jgi:signal transduction histidine kinase